MTRPIRPAIGFAAAVLVFCAATLAAATHPVQVQFVPALPLAGQTVIARLSNGVSSACWPPATSTTQDGATITLRLDYSDTCPPQYLLPSRDYVLGDFAAGNYTLQVMSCSNNPPPFPSECNVVLRAGFAVVAPVTPAPTLSRLTVLTLAGLLAVAAGFALAVRRRRKN